jgi:cellobiose phosphorylase
MNSWLLYQTYTARLLARSGFYQVGGAFGFRDQLQDVMSVMYCDPLLPEPNIKTCISSISRRRCVALVARRK